MLCGAFDLEDIRVVRMDAPHRRLDLRVPRELPTALLRSACVACFSQKRMTQDTQSGVRVKVQGFSYAPMLIGWSVD
jgi:hypothetical protein